MQDPRTLWLTVTNLFLGALVALVLVGMAAGALRGVVERWRKRRRIAKELEQDLRDMFAIHALPK